MKMTANNDEEEESLMALLDHLRTRVAYYKSKLDKSEKKLEETRTKLAHIRSSKAPRVLAIESGEEEEEEGCDFQPKPHYQEEEEEEDCKIINTKRKPLLVIPAVSPFPAKKKKKKIQKTEWSESGDFRLTEMVSSSSSPCKVSCETSTTMLNSQHKRKLRTLVLSPTNHHQFLTSALDGFVNVWQIQDRGSHATLVSSINALSPKQRRWPEDIAWHPNGGSLVSVYNADSGDSQLAILNLNDKEKQVVFLEDKPHVKGVINNVMFMPWAADDCFATCGNDHAVVLWTAKRTLWKPQVLHTNLHSSAVMGVAGMQQKRMVISVGADKKIIGFDLQSEIADYNHRLESKCMSVVPNPRDLNLFMVQTGAPQRQLRLFDMRLKVSQVHEFGWNQESSTSQSALINQAWSPDGLYITSGSADPVIHIFDIRYNGSQPSRSIKAHQKRVFKAAWHQSLPLLISISSDLNIGFHTIT
ncbi:putative transcription factor WD40-like family [Helianthus annuus]|nr:putative transcription factor WD40-like family [Helianthus annuus]